MASTFSVSVLRMLPSGSRPLASPPLLPGSEAIEAGELAFVAPVSGQKLVENWCSYPLDNYNNV
jgi:hypothetical protein